MSSGEHELAFFRKVLGIDFGEKRIGLAVSDESLTLARELTILSPKEFWHSIQSIIEDNTIGSIALGLPLGVDGRDTEKTLEVRAFKEKLQHKVQVPVHFIDERFSSAMAKNLPGGRSNTDSLAAQILLQNYLDKNKNS